MKAKHFREQSDDELKETYLDLTKKVFDAKVKKNIGETSVQPLEVRMQRRDLARIKTIMRERSIVFKA